MRAELLLAVQAVATIMAMVVLICRAGRMTRDTPAAVRHQHAALFAGLAVSLVVPPLAGKTAIVLGIVAFLALSAPRWRYGVPADLQLDQDSGAAVMLQPVATVPHTLIGEVQVDGGHLRVGLAHPGDRLTLLSYTPISGLVQMDAAAVAALRDLLADAAERMLSAQAVERGG